MANLGAALGDLDPRRLGRHWLADRLEPGAGCDDAQPAVDLSALDPRTFAMLISRASTGQMTEVMRRPTLRERVLDEIFGRMATHFRADRAGPLDAVVRWRIGGHPVLEFDRFETVILNGACTAQRGGEREPRATIMLGGVEFLRLVSGNAKPVPLFFTGKLKVTGDLNLASRLLPLFDIPRP